MFFCVKYSFENQLPWFTFKGIFNKAVKGFTETYLYGMIRWSDGDRTRFGFFAVPKSIFLVQNRRFRDEDLYSTYH